MSDENKTEQVEEIKTEATKQAIDERRKADEEKQIERGKFDDVMKKKTQEYNDKLSKLESELKNERVDKQLINSASMHKAINPEQIKDLLKSSIR